MCNFYDLKPGTVLHKISLHNLLAMDMGSQL